MNKRVFLEDLLAKDYKETWDYQTDLLQQIVDTKIKNRRQNLSEKTKNHFLFVEHPHVYTLGKSGDFNNLLLNEKQLKEKGATSVRAVCTHPVLSGKAYENIASSEMEELVVCDTIPLKAGSHEKIKVLSVDRLFANAIRNVSEFGSISSLFSIADSYQTELI